MSLPLSLALAAPVAADVAGESQRLEHCAKVSNMMETAAELRGEYGGLVTAIREIPDRLDIREFGFDRLFVQRAMLQIEILHGELTPEQIGEALERNCLETAWGLG